VCAVYIDLTGSESCENEFVIDIYLTEQSIYSIVFKSHFVTHWMNSNANQGIASLPANNVTKSLIVMMNQMNLIVEVCPYLSQQQQQ